MPNLVPNPPTNYHELPDAVLASKSGKTPFDAELLTTLKRIAQALEGPAPRGRKTDA